MCYAYCLLCYSFHVLTLSKRPSKEFLLIVAPQREHKRTENWIFVCYRGKRLVALSTLTKTVSQLLDFLPSVICWSQFHCCWDGISPRSAISTAFVLVLRNRCHVNFTASSLSHENEWGQCAFMMSPRCCVTNSCHTVIRIWPRAVSAIAFYLTRA